MTSGAIDEYYAGVKTALRDRQTGYRVLRQATAVDAAAGDLSWENKLVYALGVSDAPEQELRLYGVGSEDQTFTIHIYQWQRNGHGRKVFELTGTLGAITTARHPASGINDGNTWRECKTVTSAKEILIPTPRTQDGQNIVLFDGAGSAVMAARVNALTATEVLVIQRGL